jgi:cell division protein FtsI/penicillin-binding protein 2
LGSTAIEQPSDAKELPRQEPSFFWCDLKTGFIGFPSGLNLPRVMPGSLMKIVAAAALNEQHLINPNETFDCHGHFSVHKETFHCQFPHGPVDLVKAIAFSCNCFFAHASARLPAKLFLEYARKLGLADAVAKIPSGPFPTETADASLTFVLGLNPAMQPNAIQIMRMSALVGTAKKLDPENKLHIACKTGTSMHGKKFQSWVTGYFPYDAPKHAFCLCAPAGTSQEAAVPQAHAKLFETEWP